VILIVACSYTLAKLTWLLIPNNEQVQHAPVQQKTNTTASDISLQQQKIQQITQVHLFGVYQTKATQPVKTDAPETRLNLTLKGVLAATPMESASAIIAMGKSGNEDIYSIGDKVSSATVKEIHSDRVILERNGRYETLRMPKEFSENTLIQSTNSSDMSSAPKTPGRVLSDIRQQILKNPTSFGQFAIPIPYNVNGKLKGYKLRPQSDRALFDQVGLSPDDVITSINGVELDDPSKGLAALRSLQRAKQINIKVLRNGAEIPLNFEIP
jgi:general secretion pathway protein C